MLYTPHTVVQDAAVELGQQAFCITATGRVCHAGPVSMGLHDHAT